MTCYLVIRVQNHIMVAVPLTVPPMLLSLLASLVATLPHLPGARGSDFGDTLVAPSVGEVQLVPGNTSKGDTGYASKFKKKDEVARAGYYAVFLQNPGVQAELTTTPRVGIHRYFFPAT